MSKLLSQNIVRFLALVIFQVLVLNNIFLGGYVTPFLYVLFILLLPTGLPYMLMVLLGFAAGLSVDLFTNMPGLHCASATLVAFMRVTWADKILKRDSNAEIDTPSIRSVGFQVFSYYAVVLLFIYHFTYSMLELFSFRGLLTVILIAMVNTLVTWLMCLLTLSLFMRSTRTSGVTVLLPLLALVPSVARSQTAVGSWRDGLSYASTSTVAVTPGRVYAAGEKALFYYDYGQQAIQRLSKATGLSDVGIATMAYDAATANLVVVYNNANIDILSGDRVYNLSDVKRSDISGDKSIYSISFDNGKAYLACGFGIVVVDLRRREIQETWYIGSGGSYLPVYDMAFTDSLVIAATLTGLRSASRSTQFLHIADNWHADTLSVLCGQRVAQITAFGNNLLALVQTDDDTVLYKAQLPQRVSAPPAWQPWQQGGIRRIRVSRGYLIVVGSDQVCGYDSSLARQWQTGGIDWLTMDARDAALADDWTLWTAHAWAGMASYEPPYGGSYHTYCPQGPAGNSIYGLKAYKGRVMVSPGGKSSTYTNVYLPAQLSTARGSNWSTLEQGGGLDTLYDILDAAVNPKDTAMVLAASWGRGVVEIRDRRVVNVYNESNTGGALRPYTSGSFSTLRVGAVAFDNKGNAWVTNSLTTDALAVRRKDGTWQSFNTQSVVGSAEVDKILWDSVNNYKWFAGKANRIYVHDGDSLLAYVDPNNGSRLETSTVNCMAQDHDGEIWIGTNKGIKVIYDAYRAFQNGGHGEQSPVSCSNILFQGENTEYLMAYENVTVIAVDGANRKWVGTSTGGLYLLSASGLEQLEHFTASNSPLFSNKIEAIAVQPQSGEVYIGTDQGLVIYRGTATYATSRNSDEIRVFPNPVTPDYDEPVAIKGFSRNAIAHITDAAGHVVFSGKANGGQVVWNCRTNSGQRVSSGPYFVFATDEEGKNRAVAKILIIR